jgi:hypothetical protein
MSSAKDRLRTDLPHIQWGLLAVLLALGIGGAVVMLTDNFLTSAQKLHADATKRLSDARKNLGAAQEDRMNMAAYAEEYAALLKRNIIGNEQRLDLIDGLEAIRNRNVVLGFKYAIAPQEPYKPPVALDSGNFAINMSRMSLSFDLLHEGQLAKFFDMLRNNANGWYMLDGCTVERLAKRGGGVSTDHTGLAPQLKAECKGEWLTLKNRNAP